MSDHEQRILEIERVFDLPREKLFAAWSSAKHLSQWYGPNGFEVPDCIVDFRPGGALSITMRAPNGMEMTIQGRFVEIVDNERIVFETANPGPDGVVKVKARSTLTFEDHEGGTKFNLHEVYTILDPSGAIPIEMATQGWNQAFDKMGAFAGSLGS